jgi:EpsI family protein
MPDNKPGRPPLLSSTALIICGVLLLQLVAYAKFTRVEKVPQTKDLAFFPNRFGNWTLAQDAPIDQSVQDILKADDTLNRQYTNDQLRAGANLFIASFRSQRHGAAPHSPKNCLPGSGWTPVVSDHVQVSVPGRGPIEVNRYLVQRGDAKSLVLYWYQSRDRIVASEYGAKLYTMLDAVRENRTDTALVRVVIGLNVGDEERTQQIAEDFVRSFFPELKNFLPH